MLDTVPLCASGSSRTRRSSRDCITEGERSHVKRRIIGAWKTAAQWSVHPAARGGYFRAGGTRARPFWSKVGDGGGNCRRDMSVRIEVAWNKSCGSGQ